MVSHCDNNEVDLKYIRQMVAGEISTNSREKRYIHKNGSIVWINLAVSLIRSSLGEPEYLLGIIEDISDRQRAEDALRESENHLRTIIDAQPECVKMIAPDGSILEMNAAGLGMIEVDSAEQVIGQSVYSLVAPEYREAYKALNESVCQGNKETFEFEMVGCKGTRRWMETHAAPLYNDSDGTFVQLAITRDITERKRIQEALQNLVAGTASVVGEKFFYALVRHLAAALGVRYAFVTEVINGQLSRANRARTLAIWASDQLRDNFEYDVANTPCQIVINQGRTCYYSEGVQELFPQDQDLVTMQAECYLGVPLFDTSQQIIGHLCVLDSKPLIEEERTKSIISIFAGRAAAELERKRVEEERERLLKHLKQERSLQQATLTQLEAVLQQMPAGVIIAEAPSGRFILGNQQMEQIWRHPFLVSEDIEKYQAWKGFHPDGRPYQPQEWPLARSLSTGEEVTNEEIEILRGDRTRGVMLVSSTPIRDSEGSIIAAVVTLYDITERKRAEQEIRELNQNLERRVAERTAEFEATNKELEAFSYSVSHDLRAPLRGIDGFSQVLLERYGDKLDDKGKHYLKRIRAGTQRMGELIDDLLQLSRVTRSEMYRTQVDLSVLAQVIAKELQQTQPSRQVEWAIAPGLIADGDARLLRIVLENLLNNAWKFTLSRIHSYIELNVMLQEDAKFAYFVRDNGAGFDMVYANKLFGAFQRLHSTTEFPGTGIGLATVQRLIHRHGGRVWAEGAVDVGATFYFTL